MTLRTLNYGNYGIFLIMGNAGFCPSTVWGLIVCSGFAVQVPGGEGRSGRNFGYDLEIKTYRRLRV